MKKFTRTIAAVITAITMTAAAVPTGAYAADVVNTAVQQDIIKGTIELNDTKEYFYSDEYFSKPGSEINEHMRTMSAALEFSLNGTGTEYYNLLENIGFTDVRADDMYKTGADTIGSVIAHKVIDGAPVVAVAIRGNGYAQEFSSNFKAGTEGDAKGFSEAAQKVEARVKDYVSCKGFEHAKYWVVGYSRSGAVANLVGRDMNKDNEGFRTSFDDIYTYTFEAPNASADDTCFENIHNIYDRNDLVPCIYPESWGIFLNGVKEEISGEDVAVDKKVMDLLSKGFMSSTGTTTANEANNNLVKLLADNISRETFSTNIEEHLGKIMNIWFSMNRAKREAVNKFLDQMLKCAKADIFKAIPVVAGILSDPTSEKSINGMAEFFEDSIDKASKIVNNPFTAEETETFKAALRPIFKVFMPVIKKDFDNSMTTIFTVIGNVSTIISTHYNHNVFDKLTKLDSFYAD